MTALSSADRAALDAAAAGLRAEWRCRRGRTEMVARGTAGPVRLQVLRRPKAACALRPPRLRFDRVALRVCRDLNAAAASQLPSGTLAFVTLRAPIRQASRTVAAIVSRLVHLSRRTRAGGVRPSTFFGNRVRVALLTAPRPTTARLVCLVHTVDADAGRLLRMTRDLLDPGARAAASALQGWRVMTTPERSTLLPVYRHLYALLRLPARALMVFGDGKTARLD